MNKHRKNTLRAARAAGYDPTPKAPPPKPPADRIIPEFNYVIKGTELQLLRECMYYARPDMAVYLSGEPNERYGGIRPREHKAIHSNLGQVIARVILRGERT